MGYHRLHGAHGTYCAVDQGAIAVWSCCPSIPDDCLFYCRPEPDCARSALIAIIRTKSLRKNTLTAPMLTTDRCAYLNVFAGVKNDSDRVRCPR